MSENKNKKKQIVKSSNEDTNTRKENLITVKDYLNQKDDNSRFIFSAHNESSFLSQIIYNGYPDTSIFSSFNQLKLERDITELKEKLHKATQKANVSEAEKSEIEKDYENLQSKLSLNHILARIHPSAEDILINDSEFSKQFDDLTTCNAIVVSIDIRRSTELMLKARNPADFSKFITGLSNKLSNVIIENFGIFDKFTGDGILAFFPEKYSGDNAIIRALIAAERCHQIFTEHYNSCREYFSVFIKNVGLGIGVDFGQVTIVNKSNELTVVGIPVVYSCRMSGADAGLTLLNQPAKEEICRLGEGKIKVIESEIFIKNEGPALAYNIELTDAIKKIDSPDWFKKIQEESKNKSK